MLQRLDAKPRTVLKPGAKRAKTQRKNALAQHSWTPSDQPAWLTEKSSRSTSLGISPSKKYYPANTSVMTRAAVSLSWLLVRSLQRLGLASYRLRLATYSNRQHFLDYRSKSCGSVLLTACARSPMTIRKAELAEKSVLSRLHHPKIVTAEHSSKVEWYEEGTKEGTEACVTTGRQLYCYSSQAWAMPKTPPRLNERRFNSWFCRWRYQRERRPLR